MKQQRPDEELAGILRGLRGRNPTQEEMAKRLGITRKRIIEMERTGRHVTPEVIKAYRKLVSRRENDDYGDSEKGEIIGRLEKWFDKVKRSILGE